MLYYIYIQDLWLSILAGIQVHETTSLAFTWQGEEENKTRLAEI